MELYVEYYCHTSTWLSVVPRACRHTVHAARDHASANYWTEEGSRYFFPWSSLFIIPNGGGICKAELPPLCNETTYRSDIHQFACLWLRLAWLICLNYWSNSPTDLGGSLLGPLIVLVQHMPLEHRIVGRNLGFQCRSGQWRGLFRCIFQNNLMKSWVQRWHLEGPRRLYLTI